MNHFATARQEAIKAASEPGCQVFAKRFCLIFDLEGRLRVLAELDDTHDPAQLRQHLEPKLTQAAGPFWMGDFWFDRTAKHTLGKPSPSERALFDAVWREARSVPGASPWCLTLDRHFSKDGWFDHGAEAPWPLNPKTPPIISFYSYKGGVGRTTALAALAIQCARAGKCVLVLDFDLEAPGISSVFTPPSGAVVEVGILDFLIEQPVVGTAFNVAEMVYVYDNKRVISAGELRVVPAGRLDEYYLEKLARLNYQRLAAASDPAAKSPLHALVGELRRLTQPELVLIDARAGLHDLGGLALSSLAHWHVLFGLDSDQSWAGLRFAVSHLGRERILAGHAQRDCLLVQSQVRPQEGRKESEDRFLRRAYKSFCEEYYDDPNNANAEWPVPDEHANDQPHYPVRLVHDARVMGYSSVENVVNYLCEGDFHSFANTLSGKLGIAL